MTKNFSVGGGGLNIFLDPTATLKKISVGGRGSKTETGNFLRHFQNSKSSNGCLSVYGTDLIR